MDKNWELIRKTNQDQILSLIREEQKISRAKIAKQLNMSRSSVSDIVNELIEKKFVIELGLGKSTKEGGRRGVELGFNSKSAFGIGIMLTKRKIYSKIVDLDGNIVVSHESNFIKDYHFIYKHISICLKKASIHIDRIIGIGFCIPGTTDSEKGVIIDSPILKWKNVNFVTEMKKFFNIPVFINNDVNCAAMGEKWIGKAKGENNFVYITVGDGVGCSIVSNNKLVTGANDMAGEIGYFLLQEDTEKINNKLDKFGAFESRVSISVLKKHNSSIEEMFLNYKNKTDRYSLETINQYIKHLSIGISNIVSLLNPEKVIIGGCISPFLTSALEDIKKYVSEFSPLPTKIEISELKNDSEILGIVSYLFSEVKSIVI